MKFYVHGLAMATYHRHASYGGRDFYIGVAEDFLGLIDKFLLLSSVAVGVEVSAMGEEVAEYLIGVGSTVLLVLAA